MVGAIISAWMVRVNFFAFCQAVFILLKIKTCDIFTAALVPVLNTGHHGWFTALTSSCAVDPI